MEVITQLAPGAGIMHYAGGNGAVEGIVKRCQPPVLGFHIGILYKYQPVALIINHLHFACSGYFFYNHPTAVVVFITEALLGKNDGIGQNPV